MKRNNKGFSYVEFILVIAIIAILIGLAGLTIGLVSRNNITRGIEKVGSSLNQARSTAMARGSERGAIEISFDGKHYYCYVGDVTSSDKDNLKTEFATAPVEVGYYVEGDSEFHPVTQSAPLVLKYNQSTGAFLPMASGKNCKTIELRRDDKTATIVLYPATGKNELTY